MRTIRIWTLLLPLLSIGGCGWWHPADPAAGRPMYGLALNLQCERNFFETGEPIMVTVRLRNQSAEPRRITLLNPECQYRFSVAAAGQPIAVTPYQQRLERMAQSVRTSTVYCLKPGEELEYRFNLALRFHLDQAGRYTVRCRRQVSLPDPETGKEFVGETISNQLNLTIKNPPNGGKNMEKLKIGELAPDFELPDQNGSPVKLSHFRGAKVMIYFYPKASTPGCTAQSCSVRDALPDLQKLGVTCLGISADTVAAQKKFADKYHLNFPLLSDLDHQTCEAYRVWDRKSLYGKFFFGIVRSAFLIDEQGKLSGVWYKISPSDTVPTVKAALKP